MNIAPEADALVSIVIPVYNGANYLGQAIDSALDQTYPHCEVIVVNDGSNDNGQTERIALDYGDRIRYFTKPNGGVSSALNLGLSVMRGSLFSWLSHDDLYEVKKIERQCFILLNSPRDDIVVYSDYYIFSDNDRHCTIRLQDTNPGAFRYRLARHSNVNGCTLLIRADTLRAIGGFNEALRATQDYEMWFRLARQQTFIHLPEVLVGSRFHGQQGIHTQTELAEIEYQSLHAMFAKELHDYEIPKLPGKSPNRVLNELGRSFWGRGFREAALIAQQRALNHGAPPLQKYISKWAGCIHYMISLLLRRTLDASTRAHFRQRLTALFR